MDLSKLTVLITGSNTGIGFGLVKYFMEQKATIIACCRKRSYFNLFYGEFGEKTNQLHPYAFDLSENFDDFLIQIKEKHGCPDIIINNGGIYLNSVDSFEDHWDRVEKSMLVNVKAPMKIVDFFQNDLKEKKWAKIINISSKMGSLSDNTSGGVLPYRISKSSLNMLTINQAHQFSESHVKVFSVHPGWIKTKMGGENALDEIQTAVQRVLACINDKLDNHHGQFMFGEEVLPW
ncbi:MAG: SDR family NAD(P)-dependent oxidoreductase [Candidatus Cloacimonetes bacterium]|nr:SDR family NAD(P)-dependent oxidoreductase [Candidatus Cloacimonadota bacterium]